MFGLDQADSEDYMLLSALLYLFLPISHHPGHGRPTLFTHSCITFYHLCPGTDTTSPPDRRQTPSVILPSLSLGKVVPIQFSLLGPLPYLSRSEEPDGLRYEDASFDRCTAQS